MRFFSCRIPYFPKATMNLHSYHTMRYEPLKEINSYGFQLVECVKSNDFVKFCQIAHSMKHAEKSHLTFWNYRDNCMIALCYAVRLNRPLMVKELIAKYLFRGSVNLYFTVDSTLFEGTPTKSRISLNDIAITQEAADMIQAEQEKADQSERESILAQALGDMEFSCS